MHVLMTNFEANPNVGLFGYANDKYCLLGRSVPLKAARAVEKALKVPVHRITMCGTSLIGVFCNGNNSMLLVPQIAFEDELKALERFKIPYAVIRTKLTAFGNNILCNDKGCLASPAYSAETKKRIREALNVPLKPGKIADLDTVGACAALNSKGCVIHRDASQKEISFVEKLLGIECTTGSVNMGSPYIRSGVLANSNGFIVGDASGGPEVNNLDQGLGFLSK
jgi:translation initiation factor 6